MNYTIEKNETYLFHFTEDTFPEVTALKEQIGIEDQLDIDFLVRETASDEPGTKMIQASYCFAGMPFWFDAFIAMIDDDMTVEEAVPRFLADCDDIDWDQALYRTFADPNSFNPDNLNPEDFSPGEDGTWGEIPEEYDQLPPYRVENAVPGFFYTFSFDKESEDYPQLLRDLPVHPEVTVIFHDLLESWQMDVWYGVRETRLRQFALRLEVKKGLGTSEYAQRAFGTSLDYCDWSVYEDMDID